MTGKILESIRARMVDDWRHLHRFYSVRVAAMGAALLTAWPQLPDDIKALLPGWLTKAIAYLILVGVVVGAATHQDFSGRRPPPAEGQGGSQ